MISTNLVGVFEVKAEGKLVAIIYKDLEKRAEVFYKVEPMCAEEIKDMLDNGQNTTEDTK